MKNNFTARKISSRRGKISPRRGKKLQCGEGNFNAGEN
jgi:hypothetical protein